MDKMKELESGYTFDMGYGAICQFEHFPLKAAEQIVCWREVVHIVETINWTEARKEGRCKMVHRNRYFAAGLSQALSIATQVEMDRAQVSEEVVCIRHATPEEQEAYFKLYNHYENQMPAALAGLPTDAE